MNMAVNNNGMMNGMMGGSQSGGMDKSAFGGGNNSGSQVFGGMPNSGFGGMGGGGGGGMGGMDMSGMMSMLQNMMSNLGGMMGEGMGGMGQQGGMNQSSTNQPGMQPEQQNAAAEQAPASNNANNAATNPAGNTDGGKAANSGSANNQNIDVDGDGTSDVNVTGQGADKLAGLMAKEAKTNSKYADTLMSAKNANPNGVAEVEITNLPNNYAGLAQNSNNPGEMQFGKIQMDAGKVDDLASRNPKELVGLTTHEFMHNKYGDHSDTHYDATQSITPFTDYTPAYNNKRGA